jgi:hypothetical protein
MFSPLRDQSLSVEAPDSIRIGFVYDGSNHESMPVQTSESVRDPRGLEELHSVNAVGDEWADLPEFVTGLPGRELLSAQNNGLVEDPRPSQPSECVQRSRSERLQRSLSRCVQDPLSAQSVQAPWYVPGKEGLDLDHVFPHLSLTTEQESASSAGVLTSSQPPSISSWRPSPGDPYNRLEEGQILETENVTSEPVSEASCS